MVTMTDQRKIKKGQNRKVVVHGIVEGSTQHSIQVLCSGDNTSRWFKREECSPRHHDNVGDTVSATVPMDEMKNSEGHIPGWIDGKAKPQTAKKINFSNRIQAARQAKIQEHNRVFG